MKKYKLPKEFAEKWLAALRSGDYVQGGACLLSYEEKDDLSVDINKKSFCCLGVACSLTGVEERLYSGESFVSEESNINIRYMLEKGYPIELIGEEDLPYILALLNDGIKVNEHHINGCLSKVHLRKPYSKEESYKLNFSEIADFIEDNVEFY